MKKNQAIYFLFVLFSLFFITACGKSKKQKENIREDKMVVDTSSDSSDIAYSDTLKMQQGDIPPGWEKVKMWDKGYYVAFPKKPWKRINYPKKRIDYQYPKKNYDVFASITDLSGEPSFEDNKTQKTVFYEAVLKDLIADFTDSSEGKEEPEIIKKEPYLFLNIYDALRVELESMDMHVYVEYVVMGKMLYTLSFIIWGKETAPVLIVKDRFFKSFGKELQVE